MTTGWCWVCESGCRAVRRVFVVGPDGVRIVVSRMWLIALITTEAPVHCPLAPPSE